MGRFIALGFALTCACSFNASGTAQTGPSLDEETEQGSTGPNDDANTTNASTPDDATSQDDSSGGDPTSCSGVCAERASGAWQGPVYLATVASSDPPQCPAGFDMIGKAFSSLSAPEATCECDCQGGLGSCAVDYQFFAGPFCTTPFDSGDLSDNQCDSYTALFSGSVYVRANLDASAGECVPSHSTDVEPASWGEASALCAPTIEIAACGDDVCVSEPPSDFDSALCIVAEGDVECPQGAYSQRRVMFEGINDDRACTDCECSVAAAPVCSGSVYGHGEGGCSAPSTALSFGGCEPFSVSAGQYSVSATMAPIMPTQCTSSGSQPIGQAAPTGALTVCCDS